MTPVLLVKLVWLGLRDFFEQFMMFMLLSVMWWICAVTIVPGPAMTVALTSTTDPRKKGSAPELGDAFTVFKSCWKRAWGIWLFTVPFVAILAWNLAYFSNTDYALAPMIPLWFILLVLMFVFTLYAFSMAGTLESGVKNAFRGAMFVLVSRPFVSIGLSFFLAFLIVVMTVLVVPMLIMGPALIACIVNRVSLTILGEEIIDPNSPTVERFDERKRGVNPDPSFVSRFKGKVKT